MKKMFLALLMCSVFIGFAQRTPKHKMPSPGIIEYHVPESATNMSVWSNLDGSHTPYQYNKEVIVKKQEVKPVESIYKNLTVPKINNVRNNNINPTTIQVQQLPGYTRTYNITIRKPN